MVSEKEGRKISDEVKFTLRLTAEQNENAEKRAKEDGVSKNTYIARLIETDSEEIPVNERQVRAVFDAMNKYLGSVKEDEQK